MAHNPPGSPPARKSQSVCRGDLLTEHQDEQGVYQVDGLGPVAQEIADRASSPPSGGSDVLSAGFGTPDEVIHPGTTPGFDYDPDDAGWSTSNLPFFKIARYGRVLVPHLIPHWTNTSGDLNDYGFYQHPICLVPASWLAADEATSPEPRTPFEELYVRGAQGNGPVIQQSPVRFRLSNGPGFVPGDTPGLWLVYEEFDSSLFAGGNEAEGLYWNFDYQPMIVLPPGATFA